MAGKMIGSPSPVTSGAITTATATNPAIRTTGHVRSGLLATVMSFTLIAAPAGRPRAICPGEAKAIALRLCDRCMPAYTTAVVQLAEAGGQPLRTLRLSA
jgi:hypothetical protein